MTLIDQINSRFPNDHSRQIDAYYYINNLKLDGPGHAPFVIDLGAGAGKTHEIFRKLSRSIRWLGLDVGDSRQVRLRTRTDVEFMAYDGVNIPFEADSVDAIFSRQVFEHVEQPEALMREIGRVLKPGGLFMGSVSQMEPFHSQSTFNYTFYGFARIAAAGGLELVEYRPGVDALTLIARNFFKFALRQDVAFFAQWLKAESLLNQLISYRLSDEPHSVVNREKVRYCGHLCFLFRKPVDGTGEPSSFRWDEPDYAPLEADQSEEGPKRKGKGSGKGANKASGEAPAVRGRVPGAARKKSAGGRLRGLLGFGGRSRKPKPSGEG